MKSIFVASNNPVKLIASLHAFQRMFPEQEFQILSGTVSSGVPHQPQTDRETLQGATIRAQNAQKAHSEADYWIGIEGGVDRLQDEMIAFAWVVVKDRHQTGKGRTGTFYLPPEIAHLVRSGVELGEADDQVFGRENSKQENGAVGLLTGDVLDRAQLYEQAVILALIPFKNPSLYF